MIRWSIYTCFLSYKLYNAKYVLHIIHSIYKKKKKGIDEILIDGSVSQIIDLHPSFYLMKCRKLGSEKI